MKKLHRGFTLIELVVVIVLLGILSAVAIPKYIDYKSAAGTAAAKGVAAALSAASETNYAAYLIGSTGYLPGASCANALSLLNVSPVGYSISAETASVAVISVPGDSTIVPATSASTAAISCTLKGPDTITTSFNVIPTPAAAAASVPVTSVGL